MKPLVTAAVLLSLAVVLAVNPGFFLRLTADMAGLERFNRHLTGERGWAGPVREPEVDPDHVRVTGAFLALLALAVVATS